MDKDTGAPNFGAGAFNFIRRAVAHKKQVMGMALKKGKLTSNRPTHHCIICGDIFRKEQAVFEASETLNEGHCPKCQQSLDQGQIAIVCDDSSQYAFVYSAALVGQGQIIKVSKPVMDKVVEEFKAQVQERGPSADPKNN